MWVDNFDHIMVHMSWFSGLSCPSVSKRVHYCYVGAYSLSLCSNASPSSLSVSVCLCLNLCLSLSICLSLCISLSFFLSLSLSLSMYLSLYVSLSSLSLSVSVSIYLSFFSPWTVSYSAYTNHPYVRGTTYLNTRDLGVNLILRCWQPSRVPQAVQYVRVLPR